MMRYDKIIKQLSKRQAEIASVRDKLRENIADAESLADDCDEAIDNIERAVDALSRTQ
jgi:ABC-type transporter Mla subunit MlaD